jgi:hypothetical protein
MPMKSVVACIFSLISIPRVVIGRIRTPKYLLNDARKLFGSQGIPNLVATSVMVIWGIVEVFNLKVWRHNRDFDLVRRAGSRSARHDASRKTSAAAVCHGEWNVRQASQQGGFASRLVTNDDKLKNGKRRPCCLVGICTCGMSIYLPAPHDWNRSMTSNRALLLSLLKASSPMDALHFVGAWRLSEALHSGSEASEDSFASPLLNTRGDGVASGVDEALRGSIPSTDLDGINESDGSADTNDIVGENAMRQRRAEL